MRKFMTNRRRQLLLRFLCIVALLTVVFLRQPPPVVTINNNGGPLSTALSFKTAKNPHSGVIVLNILGRLANNLFEISMANRLSAQLGWPFLYRPCWEAAFPDEEPILRCFQKAMLPNSPKTWEALPPSLREDNIFQNLTSRSLWESFMIRGTNRQYDAWKEELENKTNLSLTLNHRLFDFNPSEDFTSNLVQTLTAPESTIRILHLKAFFIHYDWMKDWLPQIREWSEIHNDCCQSIPTPETVVIHWRDFPQGDAKRVTDGITYVQIYLDILRHYSYIGRPIWIVCQPHSAETAAVQSLVRATGAKVMPGADDIDAMCILYNAQTLLLTTSSTYSQFPALVGKATTVHYPLTQLMKPRVTLKVPTWHYHLVNQTYNGIEQFDVPHEQISVWYD